MKVRPAANMRQAGRVPKNDLIIIINYETFKRE